LAIDFYDRICVFSFGHVAFFVRFVAGEKLGGVTIVNGGADHRSCRWDFVFE
jgi:hypothetical protein